MLQLESARKCSGLSFEMIPIGGCRSAGCGRPPAPAPPPATPSRAAEKGNEVAPFHERSPWARTTPYHIATRRAVCCASQQNRAAHIRVGSWPCKHFGARVNSGGFAMSAVMSPIVNSGHCRGEPVIATFRQEVGQSALGPVECLHPALRQRNAAPALLMRARAVR